MPNLSSGIGIALQAVLTHSQALEITEHNVANANTPGYRRQSALLATTVPSSLNLSEYGLGAGQRGGGVTIDRIERFNVQFFDGRYRSISGEAKFWEAQSGILTQFEPIMAETSTDGLIPKMDNFWAGWEALAGDPTNNSLRMALVDDANSLASAFNNRSAQISQLRGEQNLVVSDKVLQINSMATEIATLNGEISRVISVGEQPNDLLDKRDLVLDQLAQITGAVSFEQKNGEVSVSIGGHVLVVGHETVKLKTQVNNVPASNPPRLDVLWEDNSKINLPSGELKGIIDIRDNFLVDQQNSLDLLANKMITKVNDLHKTGFGLQGETGLDFFKGTGAAGIAVADAVSADPSKIAAAAPPYSAGEVGNNGMAVLIGALKNDATAMVSGSGTVTMGEYYNGQVTNRALITRRASDNAYQHNLVARSLGDQRESVVGVNLDEEAANMAKSQKAYQAAARVMNAYDELLDLVINRMGLVGR